jgi:glycosyltransferase involved in cell wall biosynthesis
VVTHRGIEGPHAWAVRLLEVCTRRRVRYVANSRACARTIGAQIGIDADRFTVLYNGIDADSYYVPGARDEVRRELGVSDGEKLVVMVGRLTPLKNYPMLFRVARRCRKRLPIRFVIVGHGELEADLRALVIQEGIDDIVQFLGLRLDVPRLLASADVFCYTSDSEGFPNALLEAMAAGCAIVTTDFPGADELIAHERNGLIVPRDDDAAAAAAVLDLCSDRDRAAALGRCARMQAVAEFSMERMVRQTIGLYHTIIEGDT